MSTTNEMESTSLPTSGPILNPRQESSYGNQVAKESSSQWNGHQIITNNIHTLYAGNLDSSVPPPSTGLGDNHLRVPRNLSAARRQINDFQIAHVHVPERVVSPGSNQRPISSPHLSIRSNRGSRPVRNYYPKIAFGKVFSSIVTLMVLLVWPGVYIMLIFGAGDGSSELTPNVRHGFFKPWNDYTHGIWKTRVTLSEYQAKLITGSAVLILALSIPSAYILLHRIIARIGGLATSRSPERMALVENSHVLNGDGAIASTQDEEINEDTEQTSLLNSREKTKIGIWPHILRILSSSKSPHSSIVSFLKLIFRQRITYDDNWSWHYYKTFFGRVLLLSFLAFLALSVFLGLTTGAIMSAKIMTDSAILSDHPDCGLWIRNSKILNPSSTGFPYLQEVDASNYAKKCYHNGPGTEGCNIFIKQSIPYEKHSNSPCPFKDSFCLEGKSSAYTLQTGPVSSKDLGINVERGYTFKRKTTCSPIRRRASLSQDENSYEYDYGNTTDYGNLTWTSPAETSWNFAGYNVATFYYISNSSQSTWSPSPEFTPWAHQQITLLLIQSQKNYHTSPSHDPIFPAEHSLPPYPGRNPLYFNDDPIATALACVDTTEICTADGRICYPDPTHPSPELPSHEEEIGYYMLFISLMKSTTFDAIILLGSRALVAEAKLEKQISLPLAEEQWKIEAQNLFEMTLVRPFITLRDYMRGRQAGDPEYSDRTLAGMQGMCQAYKFRGRGWRNVSVWGIILIVLIVAVIYTLTLEVRGSPMVIHRDQEEHEDLDDAVDLDEEDCSHGRRKILLAERIFESFFGTGPTAERNGSIEEGTQRTASRDGTDVGQASPQICVAGPGNRGTPTPEIQGSSAGQSVEDIPDTAETEQERVPPADGGGVM